MYLLFAYTVHGILYKNILLFKPDKTFFIEAWYIIMEVLSTVHSMVVFLWYYMSHITLVLYDGILQVLCYANCLKPH